jgi:hypothetical protein
MRYGWIGAALIIVGGGAAAKTAAPSAARPAAFEALVKCRAIAEDAARLRCFDQATAALEQAAARRDLVIVDRAQVRQTKRTLFGLELPHLSIFGGGDDDKAEEVSQIEGVVASAHETGAGRWAVTLEDGGTWVQVDDNVIAVPPKHGTKVLIKKAALGSYMMRVGNQPGVRVKRAI